MKINIQDKHKEELIETAAQQWVNLVFVHLSYKKQNKLVKKDKNNNGK